MSSQLLLEMTVLPSFRSCGQHQGYVPSWSAWTFLRRFAMRWFEMR